MQFPDDAFQKITSYHTQLSRHQDTLTGICVDAGADDVETKPSNS